MMVERMAHGEERAEDASLLARAAAGDERAFRTLYDAHQRPLFRVAYGVLLDEAEAREAVQEAFLQLHRVAPRWEPRARVGTWLYRVVLRHCLDLKQRLLRLVFAPAVVQASARESPERGLSMSQSVQVVEGALKAMSPKQRAVATLHLEADASPSDIAEILEITPNDARVTLHRALTRMREALKSAGIDALEDAPTFLVSIPTEEDS
jgi:RNA polymerase sigma-70 factor (ECF subfamily)